MHAFTRSIGIASLAWLLAAPIARTDETAVRAPLAARALVLAGTAAGQRTIAVGEYGHVLLSDDGGVSWRQARYVPARTLLTSVYFLDALHGWIAGHDEIILRSVDGGETWQRTHFAPEHQRPLLDIRFLDADHGIAIGAYGSVLVSSDGGRTWQEQPFETRAELAKGVRAGEVRGGNVRGDEVRAAAAANEFHLNRLALSPGGKLYIAGEAGHLYRSEFSQVMACARGRADPCRWSQLPSPYEGSFFGLLALDADSLLAFGLRGNLFRSGDAGEHWQKIETGTTAMLNDAARLSDGRLVIVGLTGGVLLSQDGGGTFTLAQQPDRKGLSMVLPKNAQEIIVGGEDGLKTITLESAGHAGRAGR